jgi:hypothetical protein
MSKFLVLSCETSGLNMKDRFNPQKIGNGYYQSLAWGLIVVDKEFNILDELYTEIAWDGASKWDDQAQSAHQFTIEYLAVNGVTEVAALEEIGSFIVEHFETSAIQVAGCNTLFALSFLNDMFSRHGIQLKFSNKQYDLNTLGGVLFDTQSRDELFQIIGCKSASRNALITARNIVKSFKTIKNMWDTLI